MDQNKYRSIQTSFVAGVCAFAIYGIIQFAINPGRLHILNMPPISAAALFVAGLLIVLYSGRVKKADGMIAVVILVTGLITTFSRGYLLLMLITPFVFWVVRKGKGGGFLVTALAVTLVGTIIFSTNPEIFHPKNVDTHKEQSFERLVEFDFWKAALYGRSLHYAEGLRRFLESPIFGNGFHMGSGGGGRAVVWHNFHVEWLEYGGIVGYLLYISLLIWHFYKTSPLARRDRQVAINQLIILIILLNGLTNSFTVGVAPYLGFLFMGLTRGREVFQDQPGEPEGAPREAAKDEQNRRILRPRASGSTLNRNGETQDLVSV